ncbi:MAG: FtsX-like permease family protein, partial [Bacteroidota bacterium]
FTVSVTLIIGTIIVYRQIQHAKNRPIGYDREGLVSVQMNTADIHDHYQAFRSDLIKTGAVLEIAESYSPLTGVWSNNSGYDWEGKDPNLQDDFGNIGVSHEYGKTVGWQFKYGRDFSRAFATDSTSFVLNESAVKFMGLKNPVGAIVRIGTEQHKVVGVIKDVLMSSPYEPVKPTIFYLAAFAGDFVHFRLKPQLSAPDALKRIEPIFRKYSPGTPFDYKFVDQEFAKKFDGEERIGKLSGVFASLAIFISCLGLFGLTSFMAEQRTKEIGVRKVLGASVFNLWQLLSKDFVRLVIISFLISAPVAGYFMKNWLQKYDYRTELSWWIFAVAGLGALVITVLTVSFQAIKAATANPVKSLRTE